MSAGRIATSIAQLELFAQSLASDDVVALEATSGAGLIVDLLERQVARVLVANTRKLPQISRAKAKTDRLDARTLAKLAATGMLETVWAPGEQIRALRRVCARRESLVRARARAKNEAHAVLARNLCGRSPITDCFGKAGRAWLAALELPVDEPLTLDGCLRQGDFLHTLRLDDRSAGPRGSRTRAIGPVGTAARVALGVMSLALGLLASGDGIEWAALLAGLTGFPAALGLAQLLRLSVAGMQLRAAGPVAFCLNTAVLAVLLGTPVTRDPTLVFLGASMLLAASSGYPGCESVAISNWLLRRDDQVECVLFWPIDELLSRSRAEATSSRIRPALVAHKLAGCVALVVLLVDGLGG